MSRPLASAVLLAAFAACAPDLNKKASDVTAVRVVGVRAEPAEARPGQSVTWTAVVVSPDGVQGSAEIDWGLCVAPRGPTDSITVAGACLGRGPQTDADGNPLFLPIDTTGIKVKAAVPSDACAKVGPQLPAVNKNGDPQRAPEADITGGYQLPLRLVLDRAEGPDVTFFRQRVKCNLANAPASVAKEYTAQYVLNKHPSIEGIEIDGTPLPLSGANADVPAGGRYTLTVRWPEESNERYVRVNPETRSIEERAESLDVTWFTNGGSFERDRTTAGGDGTSSSNVLILEPGRTDTATVWILVHDDRGGLVSTTLTLNPV